MVRRIMTDISDNFFKLSDKPVHMDCVRLHTRHKNEFVPTTSKARKSFAVMCPTSSISLVVDYFYFGQHAAYRFGIIHQIQHMQERRNTA